MRIGQGVWANHDIGNDSGVLVQKYTKGAVQGPSTSEDKDRVSVNWERLQKTGRAGCNNAYPEWLSKTCPKFPDGLMSGQDVWANRDISNDSGILVVQRYTKGTVQGPGPSTSDNKHRRVSVNWETLQQTGRGGCSNAYPQWLSKTPLSHAPPDDEPRRKKARVVPQDEQHGIFERTFCVVCIERQSTQAFVPCGHACVCERCAGSLARSKECPVCRQNCTQIMRLFM